MPVRFVTGDLFASSAEALVNPVNTKGVMGAGLAAEFRRRYPADHTAYVAACREGRLSTGAVLFTPGPPVLAHFPTKDDWRHPSRLEYVVEGLAALVPGLKARGIRTVAVPALGCGLGGLPWAAVRPLIEAAFAGPDIEAEVYPPR